MKNALGSVDNPNDLTDEEAGKKTDNDYFNMVDPSTGDRYDIPMLPTTAPDYYFRYVYYMRIKEASPETFEKVMSWD
jgi:hypothetical protein